MKIFEEANAIIDNWLNNDQICNDFLFDRGSKSKSPTSVGGKVVF